MHYIFSAQSQTTKTPPLQNILSDVENEVMVLKKGSPLVQPFLSVTESCSLLNTALRVKFSLFLPPTLSALNV